MPHLHRIINIHLLTLTLAIFLAAACGGTETWTLVELLTKGERIHTITDVIEVRNCGIVEQKTVECSAGTWKELDVSLGGKVVLETSVSSNLGLGRESVESLELKSPPEGFVYRYTVTKEFRVVEGEVLARSSAGAERTASYDFDASCSLKIESRDILTCAEAEKPTPTTQSLLPPIVSTTEGVSVTPSSILGGRFIVVYPGQDGLSLRTGPSRSYAEITTLPVGIELVVNGNPIRGADGLKWWPVSSPHGQGWVAEWVQVGQRRWRLIKPIIVPGEVVEVANPLGEGNVNLRNQNCDEIDTLSRGTALRIVSGPESKCDTPGTSIVWEGRQWWYVMAADGTQGWIADFSEDEKAILIAPRWYVEWSKLAPSP